MDGELAEQSSTGALSGTEAQGTQTGIAVSQSTRPAHWWQPGQSGNPGGRPKTKRITDAIVAILEEDGADGLVRDAVDAAKASKKPQDKLEMVAWMADRTEGKPVQAHLVEAHVHESTAQQIVSLLEALQGLKSDHNT